MSCTVVTAYFELPYKKHSSNSYKQWISNYLKTTDGNMVIFTSESTLPMLKEYREDKMGKTKFITLELTDFYTYRFWKYWKRDHQRDHERGHHNPYLYMIWAEKSMFIKKAMDLNPFNSEFYCWTDIGMVREEQQIQHINKFPRSVILDRLKRDKVYLLNIDDFTQQELQSSLISEKFRFLNTARIGGGVILGHKDVLPRWIELFYDMLNHFIDKDFFAGKDQSLMAFVYLQNKDLIELIKPINSPIDPWFYLLYYFGNKNYTETLL